MKTVGKSLHAMVSGNHFLDRGAQCLRGLCSASLCEELAKVHVALTLVAFTRYFSSATITLLMADALAPVVESELFDRQPLMTSAAPFCSVGISINRRGISFGWIERCGSHMFPVFTVFPSFQVPTDFRQGDNHVPGVYLTNDTHPARNFGRVLDRRTRSRHFCRQGVAVASDPQRPVTL